MHLVKKRSKNLYQTVCPLGRTLEIPRTVAEDWLPAFTLKDTEALANYYRTHGYVICRDLVLPSLCRDAIDAFRNEVKQYGGYLHRRGGFEPHSFTGDGHLRNPLLNIQDLPAQRFPKFAKLSLSILTFHRLAEVAETLIDAPAVLWRNQYFESSPESAPHREWKHIEKRSAGICVWIALEEVKAGAGRFYLYPGSHHLDANSPPSELHVPTLSVGDVVFWSPTTLHGNLKSEQPYYPRHALTGLYLSEATAERARPFRRNQFLEINGMKVHSPFNQNFLPNRLSVLARSYFSLVRSRLSHLVFQK